MKNSQLLYEIKYYIITFTLLTVLFISMALFLPDKSNAQSITSTTTGTIYNPINVVVTTQANIPLCEITRSLKVGSSGEDVRCLQRYLNWSGYNVSDVGAGSPGNESSYFGTKTADAVARWQNANASQVLAPANIPTGTGYYGPLSFNFYVKLVKIALGLSV